MVAPTVTSSANSGAEVGTALLTTPASAINAAAGNTILVYIRYGGGTFTNVTDTAGNTYTPLLAVTNGNIGTTRVHLATGIIGNAANVVQANASVGLTFASVHVLQIAGAGIVDVAKTAGSGAAGTTMTSAAFSTGEAPELITVFGTTAGIAENDACLVGGVSAARIESTATAGVTDSITWQVTSVGTLSNVTATNTMASSTWNMCVVSFVAAILDGTFSASDPSGTRLPGIH